MRFIICGGSSDSAAIRLLPGSAVVDPGLVGLFSFFHVVVNQRLVCFLLNDHFPFAVLILRLVVRCLLPPVVARGVFVLF